MDSAGEARLSSMDITLTFQPKLEDYDCAICKDLVFKPAVNVCQHVFCFWCLHQSMNNISESNCPLCRREYGHLARTCGLLHFFLGSAFPAEYRARQAEVRADEEARGISAEDLDTDPVHLELPLLASTPETSETLDTSRAAETSETLDTSRSETLIAEASELLSSCRTQGPRNLVRDKGIEAPVSAVGLRPYPFATSTTKYAFKGVDFGCRLCDKLLHQPTVLNCGHVYCLLCIQARSSDFRCPGCSIMQAEDPRKLVPCGAIWDLVTRAFPEEAAARALQDAERLEEPKGDERQDPSVERPPTVQEAMSRARTILLAAHAELLRRGEPFNLRAMHARLLEEMDPKYVVHFGIGCDGCGQSPIVGERYQCQDCHESLGFDMCGHCYEMSTMVRGLFNQRHMREHHVVKIPPFQAITHRIAGIDPYRVLFTNPELPYHSVQRMREEAEEDDEGPELMINFGPEVEAGMLLDDDELLDYEEEEEEEPRREQPDSLVNLSELASPQHADTVYAQWDEDEPFARSVRRGASRTVQDAFQIPGHWGRSNRPMRTEEQPSGTSLAPEGSSGEDSDWGHRVGHLRREWRNGQTATARPGPAPGLGQPRRGGAGFFSYPWVYASGLNNRMRTMPPGGEPGPVTQDEAEARARRQHVQVRSRILSDPRFTGSFEEADQVAASVRFGEEMGQGGPDHRPRQEQQSGNGSGNGNGNGRGEWHDVHEGGAEGQEAARPGAAFRERRLRRSFGRRHQVSFPLVEAPTAGLDVDTGGESAGQSNASTQTLEEAGGGSVEASEGMAREVVRERVRRVQAYSTTAVASDDEEAAEVPARERPRERVRRVMVYSPEPVVRSRSLREPRRIDGRRGSVDGLPPLPPHRRALSSSPLERRAGLLMLTLASTAAEHPRYSTGGEPRPLLRPRPVGWHRPEEVYASMEDGGLGEINGNERVEADLESMGQQLLADYATRFDSRRTLQDVEEGASLGVSSGQSEGPAEGGAVNVSIDDVTSAGPSLSGVQLEDEPVMSDGGVSGAGTGPDVRNEDAGAQGQGDRAPRQNYSLVDSLVSAWRGQRRRPRDVQPGSGDASPSQVRRLRRPEE